MFSLRSHSSSVGAREGKVYYHAMLILQHFISLSNERLLQVQLSFEGLRAWQTKMAAQPAVGY